MPAQSLQTPIIIDIYAREIIDSRGNPTVEAEVLLDNGVLGVAQVPSGASTGTKEAVELRDNDHHRYDGKGVLKAVKNVNDIIAPAIIEGNFAVYEQAAIDQFMIDLDHTPNKSKLGANAILAVSLAIAKAAAKSLNLPLYRYLGGVGAVTLPVPMLNIVNGGAHAENTIDFQEFMIMPVGAESFPQAMQMASETYHALKKILKTAGHATGVGDEGGFAPNLDHAEEVLAFIVNAIKTAGYLPARSGKKAIAIAMDVAASELWTTGNKYHFKKLSKKTGQTIIKTSDEMIKYYQKLCQEFPIISIEDGLGEHDWDGMIKLTATLGKTVQIVGDDLYVTNPAIIADGIKRHATNSVLIKLNQIGTLSETITAIEMTKKAGWTAIVSHRSGETEDTTLADLAVALNTGQIKTGSMSRTDRIAKYNQLLRINDELDKVGIYPGLNAFYNLTIDKK